MIAILCSAIVVDGPRYPSRWIRISSQQACSAVPAIYVDVFAISPRRLALLRHCHQSIFKLSEPIAEAQGRNTLRLWHIAMAANQSLTHAVQLLLLSDPVAHYRRVEMLSVVR